MALLARKPAWGLSRSCSRGVSASPAPLRLYLGSLIGVLLYFAAAAAFADGPLTMPDSQLEQVAGALDSPKLEICWLGLLSARS